MGLIRITASQNTVAKRHRTGKEVSERASSDFKMCYFMRQLWRLSLLVAAEFAVYRDKREVTRGEICSGWKLSHNINDNKILITPGAPF